MIASTAVAAWTMQAASLINGGFELNSGSGTVPAGWSNIVNSYGASVFTNGSPREGQWVLQLGANFGSGGQYQDVPTVVGQPYLLTFYAVGWPEAKMQQQVLVQAGTRGSDNNRLSLNNAHEYVNTTNVVPPWTGPGSWQPFGLVCYPTSSLTRVSFQNVYNGLSGNSVLIDEVRLEPAGALAILIQPQSRTVGELDAAVFLLVATNIGVPGPIKYQWYRDGAALPGLTNSVCWLPRVSQHDDGAQLHCALSVLSNGTSISMVSDSVLLHVIPAPASLAHRYSFEEDARDAVGSAHGNLQGTATIGGGGLRLDGKTGSFLNLPGGLINGWSALTVEFWAWFASNGNGAKVFEFGHAANGMEQRYVYLSPHQTLNSHRLAISASTNAAEQRVEGGGNWDGRALHVACVVNPPSGSMAIYTNGVLESQAPCGLLLSVVSNSFSYLGRSLRVTDAWLNASLEEFRLYRSALSAGAVRKSYELGPELCLSDGPVAMARQPRDASVLEGQIVTLAALLNGHEPYELQWFKNGVAIPGERAPVLTFSARLSDHGGAFQLWATNHVGMETFIASSDAAQLLVQSDTIPPFIQSVTTAGLTNVLIEFSEPVNPESAGLATHYSIAGVAISDIFPGEDGRTVNLKVNPLLGGERYTLTVADLTDRATHPNLISPNPTIIQFIANPFVVRDVGQSLASGQMITSNGIYSLTSYGAGLGGTNDQCVFAFEYRPGDFDLCVRLAALARNDTWASAGLMARASLDTNAAFAGVLATPGLAGCFFQSRATTGATAARSGAFPVNYPDTWLRLARRGGVCSGYASLDGLTWSWLGSAAIAWPASVSVGLAAAAGSTNTATTAQFLDYGAASGGMVTNAPLPFEPMGPCSRRTALVISEIMYNPPDSWDTNNLQFIELHNTDAVSEDLSGHTLNGDIDFTFPPGTALPSGGYLVIAKKPEAAAEFYGLAEVLGPFSGNLSNRGGTVRLKDELGGCLLEVEYNNEAPWPVAPDGTGHSLVLRRPSYGESDPRAWAASDRIGGSPGRLDGWGWEPLRGVVINEFLANSEAPMLDFIELFNTANTPADLGGCWLSDNAGTNKFRILPGTVLPPHGFVSYGELELGFALDSAGEQLFLVNSNQTRVLAAVWFGAQAPNVSRGRQPDGSGWWGELAEPTPGGGNSGALPREIVINEIMYAPISGDSADEFIELYNRGTNPVSLAGWRLADAISFTFTNSALVPPGGYIVVGQNLANLLAKYTNLTTANTFGNYSGSLKNSGERIALQMPIPIIKTTTAGQSITNLAHVTVNEVTYGEGGQWGLWSDGGGSSLELVEPRADNRYAANWADSDESTKAPWTTVQFTGPLCNGLNTSGKGIPNRVEFFLQGPGEYLVDNVECLQGTGPNRISNPGFENGTAGWNFGGTQRRGFVESNAGVSGKALRVIAAERGDTGANKIRTAISTLTTLSNATLRAQVRWLKGDAHFLMRTRGNWLEAAGRLKVPSNCGTPGQPNSRRMSNAGPAIAEVAHAPVTPAAMQPVVVTARMQDPDGVAGVTLWYRVDPGTIWLQVPMGDTGAEGDSLAGDGRYSAMIPGRTGGTLVAFYLAASDAAHPAATSRFPAEAPARECLVRWGEPEVSGTIGAYRFWLTQSNVNFWATREKNANDGVDCTFAYANTRVIYNVQGHYKGSPAHTVNYTGPIGAACDYAITFPADDRFLGARDVVLGAEDITMPYFIQADNTAQVEVAGFWIARQLGEAYSHTRYIHLFFNGQRRATIYRDMQQPTDMVDQNFAEDPSGDVRKVEHWFEFDDTASGYEFTGASLERFTTPGGALDAKRYRWNWRPRATPYTDDFTNVLSAVMAANTPGTGSDYTSNVLAWIDARHFLRPIAVHHIVGNWDTYAYTEGHNVYAYKPGGLGWRFLLWDLDFALGSNSSRSPTDDIFASNEPVVNRMFNHPPFRREYLAAMYDAVYGPLAPGAADRRLDDRYACFQQNGARLASPASIKNYMAQRRAFLLTQLPNALFSASGPATTGGNQVMLTGAAPVNVRAIEVNGRVLPLTWTAVSSWKAPFVLRGGTNLLAISARDYNNVVVAATNLVVIFTGTNAWPPVRINEWMADNASLIRDPADNDKEDWFELFNPTPNPVELTDWLLSDLPTNNLVRFQVPSGYVIPAGGILLCWADGEPQQNSTNHSDLHISFKLDKDGDGIVLCAPDGTPIDAVAFGLQTANFSQGRYPDGGPVAGVMSVPTPRILNAAPPSAPSILGMAAQGANVTLEVQSTPGFSYHLEYTADLSTTAWSSAGVGYSATTNRLILTNSLPASIPQRFYRVRRMP